MPKLKIIPKSKARQLQQRWDLKTMPYDGRKYDWKKESVFIGTELEVPIDVEAIFVDQRSDEYGYYGKIMCLMKNREDFK